MSSGIHIGNYVSQILGAPALNHLDEKEGWLFKRIMGLSA